MASVNHGNIKNRRKVQDQKYVRGETRFYDDSDDVILTPHHSSHRKINNKYTSHRTKPKKYKKGVNYKTGWDEDDVILKNFEEKKHSKYRNHNFDNIRKSHQQRFARHHSHHHNIKSDDTILKPNFNMDSFFDDFDRH